MATLTPFLKLQKPGFNQNRNTWHLPVNGNMDSIDTWANNINQEIVDARLGEATLKDLLSVSLETDGTLKPIPSVEESYNSFLYGDPGIFDEVFLLYKTLRLKDEDTYGAYSGQSSLEDGIAARSKLFGNRIISGATAPSGAPNWMSTNSGQIQVSGASTPLMFLIDGHIARLRVAADIDVSSLVDGTYYVYADRQAAGFSFKSSTTGVISASTVQDANVSFVDGYSVSYDDVSILSYSAQVGDHIRVTSNALNNGDYIIDQIAPISDNDVLIRGEFLSTVSPATYEIIDPLGVTLGITDTKVTTADRMFIGEVDVSSGNADAVRAYHFNDVYVGEWRPVLDVTTNPTFTETWNHNLGSDVLDVQIQVKSSDPDSAIENIPVGGIEHSISATADNTPVSITNTLSVDVDSTVGAHSHNLSGGVSLDGDPDINVSSSVEPSGAVRCKYTSSQITVKNTTNGVFYKDFDGNTIISGSIRVIITKKG